MVKTRLAALLDARGAKVQRVAVDAGISDATLYNILNGGDPKLSTVARLARALGVALCDLIDETEIDSYLDDLDKIEAPVLMA